MDGATNAELVDRPVVTDLSEHGRVVLNYTHVDRIVVGSTVPGAELLRLPDQDEPASGRGLPFLERRELGPNDCLYVIARGLGDAARR